MDFSDLCMTECNWYLYTSILRASKPKSLESDTLKKKDNFGLFL